MLVRVGEVLGCDLGKVVGVLEIEGRWGEGVEGGGERGVVFWDGGG